MATRVMPPKDEMRLIVNCPACRMAVEVVVRELSVIAKGRGELEATLEASTVKHKCPKLGAGF